MPTRQIERLDAGRMTVFHGRTNMFDRKKEFPPAATRQRAAQPVAPALRRPSAEKNDENDGDVSVGTVPVRWD